VPAESCGSTLTCPAVGILLGTETMGADDLVDGSPQLSGPARPFESRGRVARARRTRRRTAALVPPIGAWCVDNLCQRRSARSSRPRSDRVRDVGGRSVTGDPSDTWTLRGKRPKLNDRLFRHRFTTMRVSRSRIASRDPPAYRRLRLHRTVDPLLRALIAVAGPDGTAVGQPQPTGIVRRRVCGRVDDQAAVAATGTRTPMFRCGVAGRLGGGSRW
jgi:hypothetical protein